MRLSEVMGAAPAAPQGQRMRLSDVMAPTPAQDLQDVKDRLGYDYSPTGGTLDNLLSGIGSGLTSTGLGVAELMGKIGGSNPVGTSALRAMGIPAMNLSPEQQAQIAAAIEAQKKQDAPLLETTAGKVGQIGGEIAASLPVGGTASLPVRGAGYLANTGRAALTGALGGAVGGAMQPVGEGDYAAEKAKQVGSGAAVGGITGGALNNAGALIERLWPGNAIPQLLNTIGSKANKSEIAQSGERLAQETGVMLTPGQVSGGKAANFAENAARQSIFSMEKALASDRVRVQQLSDYVDRVANGVSASDVSPTMAGQQVQGAARNAIRQLEEWRGKTANEDFGRIRQMTRGQASIQPTNTNQLLQEIMQENAGIGTPGGDALANFARKQLANVDPKAVAAAKAMASDASNPETGQLAAQAAKMTSPAQGNLDKLMQLRSYLSKVAGGQAKISGEGQDRRYAAMLLKSIDDDIEAAGEQIGGDLGGALKLANQRYREASQQIDSIKASPLRQVLGDEIAGALQSGQFNTVAPETVMQRLASMKPTEIGIVRGMLETDQPQAWSAFKRGFIEMALEKARTFPPSAGVNTPVLQPNVLAKALGDAKQIEAIFKPGEVSQIMNVVEAAKRLGDKTGYNFSGSGPMIQVLDIGKKLASLGTGALSSLSEVGGLRSVATMMSNADGRAMFMELSRLPPNSERARNLAARLAGLLAAEDQN